MVDCWQNGRGYGLKEISGAEWTCKGQLLYISDILVASFLVRRTKERTMCILDLGRQQYLCGGGYVVALDYKTPK